MSAFSKFRFMAYRRVGVCNQRQLSTEKSVFPWRHSAILLDRVITHDDLSGQPQNQRARFFRYVIASRELNKTYFDIFLTSSWRNDLAADFTYAFQMSVASLLSDRFHVPIDSFFNQGDSILDFNQTPEPATWTETESISSRNLVNSLIEETLLQKYSSLDPSAINLRLKITPLNARIEHAFVVPVLTRASVKEIPSIKGSYRKMEVEFQKNRDIDQARKMANEVIDATGNIRVRTVIFDVAIDCMESFHIHDINTGELLQGEISEECTYVTHLVRFEMVTTPGDEGERVHGSWQVVDWDDLSDNNQWY